MPRAKSTPETQAAAAERNIAALEGLAGKCAGLMSKRANKAGASELRKAFMLISDAVDKISGNVD